MGVEKFKEPKIKQVVWIRVSKFTKILEKAKAEGRAINSICAEIIENYVDGVLKEKEIKEVAVETYVCPKCLQGFKTLSDFESHKCVLESAKKVVQCPFCERAFESVAKLRMHLIENSQCKSKLKEWA